MSIIPIVKCSQIAKSIRFYTEVLDFRVHGVWPAAVDPAYAVLLRGDSELHLSSHAGDGIAGQALSVIVDDVDRLFAHFVSRGVDPTAKPESPIHQGPVDQTWGTREACVDDPDGNRICFVQRPVVSG
jgi:catechol 2,3-dioxygenase-like lactoylglutathione lyase family enzyme